MVCCSLQCIIWSQLPCSFICCIRQISCALRTYLRSASAYLGLRTLCHAPHDFCVRIPGPPTLFGTAGAAPMQFTCALHTYLRVASASEAAVEGLKGTAYLDNLQVHVLHLFRSSEGGPGGLGGPYWK